MMNDYNRDIRNDFPIFSSSNYKERPFVYLDSAATAHKPKCVVDAMTHFYLNEYGTVHRAIYDLAAKATEKYNSVRETVRHFLNAALETEIIFTSGTTDSINLVARSFGQAFLKEGDEVIISHAEHHANIVPWQMLVLERNIVLKVVPISDEGDFDLEVFKKLLSKKTKLVSIAYMTNTTGTIYPVKKIIELSHSMGAKVLVDGAQAVGHLPINVQELDVDFFAFSAHKIYGPTGVGVLYGKQELLEKMPPHKGGGDMIQKVTLEATSYQKPPLRFEAGTPMIAEVIGMGVAIKYLEEIGLEKVRAHGLQLLKSATSKLQEIKGLRILGLSKQKGPIITFVIEGLHPLDLGTMLGLKGVFLRTGQMCAEPVLARFELTSALRISFGIYNTLEDIDIFIESLKATMILIKPEMTY